MDGATADSLAAGGRGPTEDDQAVKAKLLTGSCLRILDQGLTANASPRLKETGRWNGAAQSLGSLKGGLDVPAAHAEHGSLPREHPLRTWTRCACSRAGRGGTTSCVTSFAPRKRRATDGSWSSRTRPWPRSRSRQGWSADSRSRRFVLSTKGAACRRRATTSNDFRAALLRSQRPNSTGCATPLLK